jgi:methylase of polypeptide subunit release factors
MRWLGPCSSQLDDRGPDRWAALSRIIREAAEHLKPNGCLAFALFDFLGIQR